MIITAPAKINIGLKVLFKREDGYHELESLMQQIALSDFLSFKEADAFYLSCSGLDIPLKENLIYKAVKLLQEKFNISRGVSVTLFKNIPVGAGLAGGSTDAAAALLALNTLWQLNLSNEELMEIGTQLGADIPFCLSGGTALARGIGERLIPLPKIPFLAVVLAKPPRLSLSTAHIFKNFSSGETDTFFSYDKLIKFIKNQKREDILHWLAANREINMLEPFVLKNYPIVQSLKNCFVEMNLSPFMSGSGPAVFAFTASMQKAKEAAFLLQQKGFESWASWTI